MATRTVCDRCGDFCEPDDHTIQHRLIQSTYPDVVYVVQTTVMKDIGVRDGKWLTRVETVPMDLCTRCSAEIVAAVGWRFREDDDR